MSKFNSYFTFALLDYTIKYPVRIYVNNTTKPTSWLSIRREDKWIILNDALDGKEH